MKTSIECLPVELWISIFSYFEGHELFHAFTNLNNYFNQLINSNYLLFNVRLGKLDINPLEYSIKPYWSESILNRIISLHTNLPHKTSHIPEFLRWHSSQLIQLKSLKLKLRGREIPVLCNALLQLSTLEYLSIECVPNQALLETILSIPNLRVCQLDFLRSIKRLNCYSNNLSNIEILHIQLQDDSNNSIIHFFLSHMPKLKRFEMKTSEIEESLFDQPLFILSKLRTMKVNWKSSTINLNFFQSIDQIMPKLTNFYLYMDYYTFDKDFFHNFIYHWWPLLEKKQQINIYIKCRSLQITIDHDMQINLDKFQSNLLAMNEKYHGDIKVKWNEKYVSISKIIEVEICKFS